ITYALTQSYDNHPHPHSFPTRRSSDLPRSARRNPGIAGKQVLMEVITAEADDCEMYALRTLRTKRTGNETGRKPDRDRLNLRQLDRKSTRLNSSHQIISYAVFCLKKKI